MRNLKVYFNLITLLLFVNNSFSQEMLGLWEITEVIVGKRHMTPVSKWTKFNSEGTFQSGNGWTQNSIGKWTFDKEKSEYLPINSNGIKDDFGPFKVIFFKDKMIWKRKENNENVTVKLKPINKLPMTPGDKVIGLWDLEKAFKIKENITKSFDPENKYYILFRPDKLYKEYQKIKTKKKANGYWHIDAHKPIITLLNYKNLNNVIKWKIDFNENELILFGLTNENKDLKLIFKRVQEFND